MEDKLLKFGGNKILRKLYVSQKKLELYDTSKIQRDLLYLKQKFVTRSPHSIKWLKWKLEKARASKMVTAVKTNNSTLIPKSKDIVKEFHSFYKSLYSSDKPSSADALNFLKKTGFRTTISDEHRSFLDSPITEEELSQALSAMKTHKAVGRDGIPSEFYKTFKHLLLRPLLDTCNNLLLTGTNPKTWNEAKIIVFPKPGRDSLLVSSYRPISLLNRDAKIFSSVMARRLNRLISDYIHRDQIGFVPNRHMGDNVWRTLNIIHYCNVNKIPTSILVLDAKKAFDSVETSYLLLLLKHMEFFPFFINTIRSLYDDPSAYISVNNHSSEEFKLTRGTWQGCPLSPILFDISLEPLAAAVRADSNISGVHVGGENHVIGLFAEDMVLYLTNPHK